MPKLDTKLVFNVTAACLAVAAGLSCGFFMLLKTGEPLYLTGKVSRSFDAPSHRVALAAFEVIQAEFPTEPIGDVETDLIVVTDTGTWLPPTPPTPVAPTLTPGPVIATAIPFVAMTASVTPPTPNPNEPKVPANASAFWLDGPFWTSETYKVTRVSSAGASSNGGIEMGRRVVSLQRVDFEGKTRDGRAVWVRGWLTDEGKRDKVTGALTAEGKRTWISLNIGMFGDAIESKALLDKIADRLAHPRVKPGSTEEQQAVEVLVNAKTMRDALKPYIAAVSGAAVPPPVAPVPPPVAPVAPVSPSPAVTAPGVQP